MTFNKVPSLSKIEILAFLQQTPYRMLAEDEQPSDPVAFIAGNEPSIADLKEGWGIQRAIVFRQQETLTFAEFASLFAAALPGRIFKLRAEVGEGKTTFLRQLALHLAAQNVLVLEWIDFSRHDPKAIEVLTEQELKTVVVVAELTPDSQDFLTSIGSRLLKSALPCPILVAGASLQLMYCPLRTVDDVEFGRALTALQVRDLLSQFRRLLTLADEKRWDLDGPAPNLRSFIAEPNPKLFTAETSGVLTRAEGTFAEERPLFVSLLEACYGTHFRVRLKLQYEFMQDPVEKTIYRTICCFHAVGLETPIEVVNRQVGDRQIGDALNNLRRAAFIKDGRKPGTLRTRNATIASVVFEQAELYRMESFDPFLSILLSFGAESRDYVSLIRKFIFSYTYWTSVLASETGRIKGFLISSLRRQLEINRAWLRSVRSFVQNSEDWAFAGSWSAAMYHLLQRDLSPPGNASIRFLLGEQSQWLDVYQTFCPEEMKDNAAYLSAKGNLLCSIIDAEEATERPRVLQEWERLLIKRPADCDPDEDLGTDFYVDLATRAAQQSRVEGAQMRHWMDIAAEAFERALNRQEKRKSIIGPAYSQFLGWVRTKLPVHDRVQVLRKAWSTSLLLGSPNPRTGTELSKALSSEEKMYDDAEKILKRILAHHCWGEAMLELARTFGDDESTRQYLKEYAASHKLPDIAQPAINTAMACHAMSVVYRFSASPPEQAKWLQYACDHYDLAGRSMHIEAFWLDYAMEWKDAVTLLGALDSTLKEARSKQWKQAEKAYAIFLVAKDDAARAPKRK